MHAFWEFLRKLASRLNTISDGLAVLAAAIEALLALFGGNGFGFVA